MSGPGLHRAASVQASALVPDCLLYKCRDGAGSRRKVLPPGPAETAPGGVSGEDQRQPEYRGRRGGLAVAECDEELPQRDVGFCVMCAVCRLLSRSAVLATTECEDELPQTDIMYLIVCFSCSQFNVHK